MLLGNGSGKKYFKFLLVVEGRNLTLNDILIIGSIILLVGVAVQDVVARTVSDHVTVAMSIAGLTMRLLDGTVVIAGVITIAVFLAAWACWYRSWLGGGDVKLLGATMLLVPPPHQVTVLLLMSLIGGAISAVYLVTRQWLCRPVGTRPSSFAGRVWRVEQWRLSRGGPIPYAVAIAAGAIGTLASESLAQ